MSIIGRVAPFLMGSAAAVSYPLSANLLIHLDADDSSTITVSGGKITNWVSKEGNAYSFTAAAGAGPVVETTWFSPRSSVNFGDGTTVRLNYATGVSIPENSTVYMVVLFYKPNAGSTYRGVFIQKGTATNAISGGAGRPWWGFTSPPGTNPTTFSSMQQSGTVYEEQTTGQAWGSVTQPLLLTYKLPDPNAGAAIRVNGTGVSLTLSGSTNVPAGMVINTIGSTDTTYRNCGSIAEILVYDGVHSADDVLGTEAYLKAKWGTP